MSRVRRGYAARLAGEVLPNLWASVRESARDRDLDARLAVALGWTSSKTCDGGWLLGPPREKDDEEYACSYDEAAGPMQFVPHWSTSWQDAIPLLEMMTTCAAVQLSYSIYGRWSFVSNGAGGYVRVVAGSGPEAITTGVLQVTQQARWVPSDLSNRPMLFAE